MPEIDIISICNGIESAMEVTRLRSGSCQHGVMLK